jgi:hypothetical protein
MNFGLESQTVKPTVTVVFDDLKLAPAGAPHQPAFARVGDSAPS